MIGLRVEEETRVTSPDLREITKSVYDECLKGR